jgi:hypothetical protein
MILYLYLLSNWHDSCALNISLTLFFSIFLLWY